MGKVNSMIGYTKTNRGRFKCAFCDHDSYKTLSGIMTHLDQRHHSELIIAHKDAEIERLKNRPPKVEVRERIVYRDAPKPKKPDFWYGPQGIYCTSCKSVIKRPGIPVGQTIENTPCECGNKTFMLITEFK